MNSAEQDSLILEQIAYYEARAGEYDEWFFRKGRYDRGDTHRAEWFSEVGEMQEALRRAELSGDVLEIAGGTGLWTQILANTATRLTVLDASPAMVEQNRSRVKRDDVEYQVQNIFEWAPDQTYDAVFFGFWLSHVPEDRFRQFWKTVESALKPGGSVFLIDSQFERDSTAQDHVLVGPDEGHVTRNLNDGRSFKVVKRFHDADSLGLRLSALGWTCSFHNTRRFFVYGTCRRNSGQ